MNKAGIEAVMDVLRDARKVAKTLPNEKRVVIEKICSEIEALMQELEALQARGEVRLIYASGSRV